MPPIFGDGVSELDWGWINGVGAIYGVEVGTGAVVFGLPQG